MLARHNMEGINQQDNAAAHSLARILIGALVRDAPVRVS